MSKIYRLFVVLSVVLNVALIGALVGNYAQRYGREQREERILSVIAQADVAQERKDMLAAEMRGAQQESQRLREAVHAAREQAISILAAKNFDSVAFAAALERSRTLRQEQRTLLGEALLHVASALPHHDRRSLAEVISRRGSKHAAGHEGR